MNDPDFEELSGDDLLDVVYSLRDEVADLKQTVAELEYENRAEIRRHHEAFTKVQGLLSDIEGDLRWFSGREMTPSDDTLDEWFSIIRSIRNIVG